MKKIQNFDEAWFLHCFENVIGAKARAEAMEYSKRLTQQELNFFRDVTNSQREMEHFAMSYLLNKNGYIAFNGLDSYFDVKKDTTVAQLLQQYTLQDKEQETRSKINPAKFDDVVFRKQLNFNDLGQLSNLICKNANLQVDNLRSDKDLWDWAVQKFGNENAVQEASLAHSIAITAPKMSDEQRQNLMKNSEIKAISQVFGKDYGTQNFVESLRYIKMEEDTEIKKIRLGMKTIDNTQELKAQNIEQVQAPMNLSSKAEKPELIIKEEPKKEEIVKKIAEINKEIAKENKIDEPATKYTIQKGDTLSQIAKRSGCSYSYLAKINDINDPNKIYVGQEIILPVGSEIKAISQAKPTIQQENSKIVEKEPNNIENKTIDEPKKEAKQTRKLTPKEKEELLKEFIEKKSSKSYRASINRLYGKDGDEVNRELLIAGKYNIQGLNEFKQQLENMEKEVIEKVENIDVMGF